MRRHYAIYHAFRVPSTCSACHLQEEGVHNALHLANAAQQRMLCVISWRREGQRRRADMSHACTVPLVADYPPVSMINHTYLYSYCLYAYLMFLTSPLFGFAGVVVQQAAPQAAPSLTAGSPSLGPPQTPSVPSLPNPRGMQPPVPSPRESQPPIAQTPQTPSGPDLVPELMQKPKTGRFCLISPP